MGTIAGLLVLVGILASIGLISAGIAVYYFGRVARGQQLMRTGATAAVWSIGFGFVVGIIVRGGATQGEILHAAIVIAVTCLVIWIVKQHRKG